MITEKNIIHTTIGLLFFLATAWVLKYAIQAERLSLAPFALIGVAAVFFALLYPKKYIYGLFFLHLIWPLVNALRVGLVQAGALSVLFLIGIIIVYKLMRTIDIGRFDLIDYLLLAQLVDLFVSYNAEYGWYVWFWGFKQESRMILFLLALRSFKYDKNDARSAVRFVCCLGGIAGAYAVYQYFFDYTRLLAVRGMAESFLTVYGGQNLGEYAVKRAYSFILSPLTLGFVMVQSSTLSFLAFTNATKRFWRIIYAGAFVSSVGGLVLSFTRTAWAALVVAFLLMFILYPKLRKYIMGLGVLGGICFVLLFGVSSEFRRLVDMRLTSVFDVHNEQATSGHYAIFENSVEYIKDHPWGIGLGTATQSARFIVRDYVWTESGYLSRAVQTGLIGMGIYLVTFFVMITKSFKRANRSKEGSWEWVLAVYCGASITGLLVADTYGYPFGNWNALMWMLFPFAIACPRKRDEQTV